MNKGTAHFQGVRVCGAGARNNARDRFNYKWYTRTGCKPRVIGNGAIPGGGALTCSPGIVQPTGRLHALLTGKMPCKGKVVPQVFRSSCTRVKKVPRKAVSSCFGDGVAECVYLRPHAETWLLFLYCGLDVRSSVVPSHERTLAGPNMSLVSLMLEALIIACLVSVTLDCVLQPGAHACWPSVPFAWPGQLLSVIGHRAALVRPMLCSEAHMHSRSIL
eukprot:1159446-Pelagomonas_calceolata.AAC.3